MNLDRGHRSTIILLVVGLAALGVMLTRVDRELADLSHTLLQISEAVRSPKSSGLMAKSSDADAKVMRGDSARAVNQKAFKVGAAVRQLEQRCDGRVGLADNQKVPFCVGQNQLVLMGGNDGPMALDTRDVADAQAAPVLGDVQVLIPKVGTAMVLLSYGPDTCITTNDCGVGGPIYQSMHVLSLGDTDMPLRSLGQYPDRGFLSWNPSYTKAVVVPDTCGGAGCSVAVLTGYDLSMDAAKSISTEQAVGMASGTGDASDIDGKKLPEWGDVTWSSDTQFTAIVKDPNGKTRKIEGSF